MPRVDAWRAIGIWVAGASIIAFGLALVDKASAGRRRRVPERTLLLVALAGGSPGLILGMLVARHKTRKPSFLFGLALVLAAQSALVWWLTR